MGWGGVLFGAVCWSGAEWGGVPLLLSNSTLSHAHSHPSSHNIRNILDRETCANKNNPSVKPEKCVLLFRKGQRGEGVWEKASAMGQLQNDLE